MENQLPDLVPSDFAETEESIFFVYDRTRHGFLAISPQGSDNDETLSLFTSRVDAEECLVAWGQDDEDWVIMEIEDDKQLLLFLWTAMITFDLFTFNPPLSRDKKYTCYWIEDLLSYAVAQNGLN